MYVHAQFHQQTWTWFPPDRYIDNSRAPLQVKRIYGSWRVSTRVVAFTNRAHKWRVPRFLPCPYRSTPRWRSVPPSTNTPIVSFNKLVPQCHSIFRRTMCNEWWESPEPANNWLTTPMAANCSLLWGAHLKLNYNWSWLRSATCTIN